MIKFLSAGVGVFLISVTFNLSFAKDLAKPALMLANVYHSGVNLSDYWVSEKYDGVRAIWNGKHLVSRGGNIYHAPRWFIENFPKQQRLDGELWLAHQKFEALVSTVRDRQPDHKAWKKVKFMVFDMPDSIQPFTQRIDLIKKTLNSLNIPWLKAVKQWKVTSHTKLMRQLKKITQSGAEGLMLHRGSSFYKGKRSGDLLKVKPYEDAEAVVIEHIGGKGKYKGKMGALLVTTPSGLSFKIGTGFSDDERQNPPKLGDTITYQYRGKTKNGVPRFASFLRIRAPER
jgi:DNA ligase-1